MVIIGVDPHKDVLVAVAVDGNGRQLAVREAAARPRGFKTLLAWANGFEQRLRAVEDVRHVAGGFVRFLLAAGEQCEVTADVHVLLRDASTATRLPWQARTVTLVCVGADGVVAQAKTVPEKRDLLDMAGRRDLVLVAWPGQWSQDVHVVDDRKAARAALDTAP